MYWFSRGQRHCGIEKSPPHGRISSRFILLPAVSGRAIIIPVAHPYSYGRACDRCGYGSMTIERSVHRDMVLLPGGTFRMGWDCHYPEEAPAHRVTVASFWIDRTPVTNGQFRAFVDATGYVTVAEMAPDAKDYLGALPHMLKPGALVFTSPSRELDLCHCSQWWRVEFGANWRRPYGRGCSNSGMEEHPVVHVAYQDPAEFAWGDEFMPGGRHMANSWQGDFPRGIDHEPQ